MDKLKKKSILSKRQIYRKVKYRVQKIMSEMQENNVCTNTLNNSLPLMNNDIQEGISDHQAANVDSGILFPCSSLSDSESIISEPNNFTAINSYPSTDIQNFNNIQNELVQWTLKYKVSHVAVNDLLKILQPVYTNLPLDCRTLLKTPISTKTIKMENGEYCHFGLVKKIVKYLPICYHNYTSKKIQLVFNIDGIPLFHSSNLQFWPILTKIVRSELPPFVVGVFCGSSKPKPLDLYLKHLLDELSIVLKEGITFENELYVFEIHSFICDAPARAYLKCVKLHCGYSSCDKCMEPGEYVANKIVFPGLTAQKRTDASFRAQIDEDHHTGFSPLLKLPLDFIRQFPTDYMHAVCLGVMKKLLNCWTGGPLSVRLNSHTLEKLSNNIMMIRSCVPNEINRKPRGLSDLARWKASEFRTFLLYLGPVVLKKVVSSAVYKNFLLFHTAIFILVSQVYITKFGTDFAGYLLKKFIKHCEQIYGTDFLVYNVHLLSHLHEDANNYGPLDNFSAFPFENYLGQLKSMIKSPNKPLQQIHRRIEELMSAQFIPLNKDVGPYMEHNNGPLKENVSCRQYKKLNLSLFTLTTYDHSSADCYFLSNKFEVVQVLNIISKEQDIWIIGKKFTRLNYTFYEYPFDSDNLQIYVLDKLHDNSMNWNFKDIYNKCLIFPYKQTFISFPLIHSLKE